jgi:transposase
MHYLIDDTQVTKILNLLDTIKGIHKKNKLRLRVFIDAVYYIIRSGCQWRLLPFYYGDWRAIHKRFREWSHKRIWFRMFEYFKQDPDMEWTMIDSTIVRAHACAAGYGKDSQKAKSLGRSKGGFTTKIHALVDALGNPLKFLLTPGQRNDITQAELLYADIQSARMIADKGYDSDAFIQFLRDKKCDPTIPPRKNRKELRYYDEFLYQERHPIECFFGKIKHFRRVFSRYDKSAQAYLSVLYFVGVLIWIR